MSYRYALVARLVLMVLAAGFWCGKSSLLQAADTASLKDLYKDDFLIGVALGGTLPSDYNAHELSVIKSQFNAVTPENCMKPESVHPEENTWTFEQADALVKFAQENNIPVFGHTLVWHHQTPKWFFEDDGKPISREKALERMKTHINTVMGRYKGKIRGWDVVNEAVAEGGPDDMRKTPWLQAVGDDYVIKAYQFAHEADPNAQLQYNEYDFENGPKHDKTMRLVKKLLDAGIPLTAVGIQGHYKLGHVPYAGLEKTIEEIQALGLKAMITELDLDVTRRVDFTEQTDKQKAEDLTAKATTDAMQKQAEEYAKLFALFDKHKDAISRVTFWGLNDGRSWLVYSPKGRKLPGIPLLFDDDTKPKPAFQAVADVKEKQGK